MVEPDAQPKKGSLSMKNDPYVMATFLKAREQDKWAADGTRPIVTLSRQHGSGGSQIALRATELLSEKKHGGHPWIVVDKEIAERVINDHHLPARISKFLSEKEATSVEGRIDGLLGFAVPYETIIRKMAQTMVQIAKLGHVILVGRAAHVITAGFPRALHVRIIGSLEKRVERIMESENCSRDKAAARIMETDELRRHFAARHFKVDLNDPAQYDLTINTDRVTLEDAAQVIVHTVSLPHFRDEEARHLVELRHLVLD